MAVGGCAFSSDDIVIKSPTDRRLYRYIRLNNGLCGLLIHDPDIYSNESITKGGGGSPEDEEMDEDSGEEEEDSEEDDDVDDDNDSEDDKGKQGASQCKKVISPSSIYLHIKLL